MFRGRLTEWFKVPVLKTGVRQRTEGSNPSPSARKKVGESLVGSPIFLLVKKRNEPKVRAQRSEQTTLTFRQRLPKSVRHPPHNTRRRQIILSNYINRLASRINRTDLFPRLQRTKIRRIQTN